VKNKFQHIMANRYSKQFSSMQQSRHKFML